MFNYLYNGYEMLDKSDDARSLYSIVVTIQWGKGDHVSISTNA